MQTKVMNTVSLPVQASVGNNGRKSESVDKSFSNCLTEKQQQSSQTEKASAKQNVEGDTEQPTKDSVKQLSKEEKTNGKDETTSDSASSSSTQETVALSSADQAVVQQTDVTADLTLRMVAFAPVAPLLASNNAATQPTKANGSVGSWGTLGINNAATVDANAGSVKGMANLLSAAETATLMTNPTITAAENAKTQTLSPNALTNAASAIEDDPAGTIASTPVLSKKNFMQTNGTTMPETATDSTEQATSRLKDTPVQTMPEQQSAAVMPKQSQQTAIPVTPTTVSQASEQPAVLSEAAVLTQKPETPIVSSQQKTDQSEEKLQQDAPVQVGRSTAATATQADTKSGQFADQGQQKTTDTVGVDQKQEKTTDANPLNFSSMRSNVEVVSHSGAVTTNQATVKADDVLRQVADQVHLVRRPGTEQMVMHLKPEQLGDVTVKLLLEGGKLTATFHADNPEVRAVLENSLQQLKQELTSVGIKVHDVGVYTGLGNPLSQDSGQQGQAWAGMTGGNNSDGRKTMTLSEAAMEELEQQSAVLTSASSESGVDYRV